MTTTTPSRFAQDVLKELEEMARLDMPGAAKAAARLKDDPSQADEYDNMKISDAADLLISIG